MFCELFWEYEWMLETVMYYVFRVSMVAACVVYIVDTARKWARKGKKRK